MFDLGTPARLRDKLAELYGELLALHDGQQTLEAIVSTRERRAELIEEIARIERALERGAWNPQQKSRSLSTRGRVKFLLDPSESERNFQR
jgi:hypothetical protein